MIWFKRSLIILALIAVWSLCSWAGLVNAYLLPAPWKIAVLTWEMVLDGSLWIHIRISLVRVVLGFGLAFCLAFPTAILVGLNRTCLELLETPLEFVRHIPPLATTPLLILWMGIGEASKLTIIVLATFFPIFLNTVSGVIQCDVRLIEVGHVLGLGRVSKIVRIILPSALPVIIVGMRLGLGYSWRALIGAELLAATAGLGYMIIDAEELARPDKVLVGIIIIGALGHLMDKGFSRASRLLIPWQEMQEGHGRP
ncbi:MAG: ABC transporter permease [Pseudomonadota bacterium]